jgi:hypothetical protein
LPSPEVLTARYVAGFDAERLVAADMKSALADADAVGIRQLVDGLRVATEVRVYIADITRSTRDERMLSLGASPRATVALFRAARAAAELEGRDFVTPDDVKGVTPAVLRHRINLAPELEVEGRSPDDVLGALLARVVEGRLTRLYCLGIATFLTFIVGVSRVFLGVHYPTDVLGGWMLGFMWAAVIFLAARRFDRVVDREREQAE